MSRLEALDLLQRVRLEYITMARDCHRLRKLTRPFSCDELPVIALMESGIRDLMTATRGER